MKISSLGKYALAITTGVALLAGCSSNGGSSLAPSNSTGMSGFGHIGRAFMYHGVPLTAARPYFAAHGPISPDRKRHRKKPDQYVADFYGNDVLEFDYPKGDASIGTITGITNAQGECTNVTSGVGTKTFWVTATGSDAVDEFDVGGTTPIKTLTETTGAPAGCAIDPATGNLALTILTAGDVVIYTKASGTGTVISTPLSEPFFPAYDKSGNLYIDGFNNGTPTEAMLKKGSSTFQTLTLSNTISFPGNIQFDGKYITINDQNAFAIYGYTCSGTSCTLAQTVSYSGATDCDDTWIGKGVFFCPDAGAAVGRVYKYPAGGSPIATLTGTFTQPIGAVEARK